MSEKECLRKREKMRNRMCKSDWESGTVSQKNYVSEMREIDIVGE